MKRPADKEQVDLFQKSDEDPRRVAFRGWTFRAELDEKRLTSHLGHVFYLLLDEQWHTLNELRLVGGSSGDRRARDLREWFAVEACRAAELPLSERVALEDHRGCRVDDGLWVYRIRPGTITREKVDRFYREAKIPVEGLTRSANLAGFPPKSEAPTDYDHRGLPVASKPGSHQ